MTLRLLPAVRPPSDDRALVTRLLAGDEAAFEAFFADQFPALYRYTLSRLKNGEATRDVVQTTLCNAIANLRSWRGDASLTAWLFTICSNEINLYFRKLKQRPLATELDESVPEVADALAALGAPDADPEQALGRKQTAAIVHSTLDRLPPHYGQALEWKYLEGLPVEEIARRLAVGPKAAESLLTRARGAFRELFAKMSTATAKSWSPIRLGSA